MSNGMETRAQMDQEGVRGLLLINGGGAVALLAFFQGLLDKPDTADLRTAVLLGLPPGHRGRGGA